MNRPQPGGSAPTVNIRMLRLVRSRIKTINFFSCRKSAVDQTILDESDCCGGAPGRLARYAKSNAVHSRREEQRDTLLMSFADVHYYMSF